MQIMKPHITDALESYGIYVAQRRTNGARLLEMSSITYE